MKIKEFEKKLQEQATDPFWQGLAAITQQSPATIRQQHENTRAQFWAWGFWFYKKGSEA